ncbi:MAG: YHS domain-containing protein [Planctomycetota bacterium]
MLVDEVTAADWGGGPMLGVVAVDVVALVDGGVTLAGTEGLARTFRHFEYRFAHEASLAVFEREPLRYAVQLGGACGRMGALSGLGSPAIRAMHRGRLYFFASEACREEFLVAPERCLAPLYDEFLPPAGAVDGREAWARTLSWLGGPPLEKANIVWTQDRDVSFGGVEHTTTRLVRIGPLGSYRTESAYDRENYVQEIAGAAGGRFIDPLYGSYAMVKSQERALVRESQEDVLAVAMHYDPERDRVVALEKGPRTLLILSVNGIVHRLETEAESGAILSHEYLAFDPEHGLAPVRTDYEDWENVKGLRLPFRWRRSMGREAEIIDRKRAYWNVTVNGIAR